MKPPRPMAPVGRPLSRVGGSAAVGRAPAPVGRPTQAPGLVDTEPLLVRLEREVQAINTAMAEVSQRISEERHYWVCLVFQVSSQKLAFLEELRWDVEKNGSMHISGSALARWLGIPLPAGPMPRDDFAPLAAAFCRPESASAPGPRKLGAVGRVAPVGRQLQAPEKAGKRKPMTAQEAAEKNEREKQERGLRESMKDVTGLLEAEAEADFWCCVIFETPERKAAFLSAIAWDTERDGDVYLSGTKMARLLGVPLPPGPKWKEGKVKETFAAYALPVVKR